MPDYQQAKIYKIVNHELKGLVYYGSTTATLKKRFSQHKTSLNCSSKALFSVGYPEIILLEYYPCETKQELEERERVWIEGNECVNKYITGRTAKEHKELKKEYYKQYRQDNNEQRKEKFDCECGGKYTHTNISIHLKSKKHIMFSSTQQCVGEDHVNLPT
mgnify:CR=1 FL=1